MAHEDESGHFVRSDRLTTGPFGRRRAPYDWERMLLWAIVLAACGVELGQEIVSGTTGAVGTLLP